MTQPSMLCTVSATRSPSLGTRARHPAGVRLDARGVVRANARAAWCGSRSGAAVGRCMPSEQYGDVALVGLAQLSPTPPARR